MDHKWLSNLDQQTAVLVPTRSLANTLNEQIAEHHIEQGQAVWEAPNILVWPDYVRLLWQKNRNQLSGDTAPHTLISAQQSAVLLTQVIENSRRQERELTLLNVQQTVRAVQRSWRLMNDWRIEQHAVKLDHVADTEQFLAWLQEYQAILRKRGLIDEARLLSVLGEADNLVYPFRRLIWHAYDLVTAAQHQLNQSAQSAGVIVEVSAEVSGLMAQSGAADGESQCRKFLRFPDSRSEVSGALLHAREYLERKPDCTINIVIPDLQDRHTEVVELARQVFYPDASPMQVQQNNTAYRFSLGQPLADWAAIETALSVIRLLGNRVSITDLSFLLRNQFLATCRHLRVECRLFDRWLKSQRMRNITVDNLSYLYAICLEQAVDSDKVGVDIGGPDSSELMQVFVRLAEKRGAAQETLGNAKLAGGYAALPISEWISIFTDWLDLWGWSSKTSDQELTTVQHQLHQRWIGLLDDFAGLVTVQRQAGLKRAIDLLQQMARDAMFLPKAVASPILISSVLEAIGRPADICFLTGMDQSFPAPARSDAFVSSRLLADSNHPDASAESSYAQAERVNLSLLSSAGEAVISYAKLNRRNTEIIQQVSPLYRTERFVDSAPDNAQKSTVELQDYLDTQGPAWTDPGRAKGGSRIFENQSNCAFKAFVTHQLEFEREDEAEFGLDGMDRGNVVHRMLDFVWARLQTQSELKQCNDTALESLINSAIDAVIDDPTIRLTADKRVLLAHERPRLLLLIKEWLQLEASRPEPFAVVEREEARTGELAGIKFKYIVDRLDMTDDGRSFIIDYKTGTANRKDWTGDRIKSPQMPLYAVALDAVKTSPISGIAYAKVNRAKHEIIELSEAGVFRRGKASEKMAEQWHSSRASWDALFDKLANDFLAGDARVNPIDDETCRYCDLSSVCRISQLRLESSSDD